MAGSDQDPNPTPVPARRRRWPWISALVGALVAASALFAVPAIAQRGGNEPGPSSTGGSGKVIVCESGVVDHGGGIQTSSAVAERVPADAPVPEGCRAG